MRTENLLFYYLTAVDIQWTGPYICLSHLLIEGGNYNRRKQFEYKLGREFLPFYFK
jgi:hypothetical protein